MFGLKVTTTRDCVLFQSMLDEDAFAIVQKSNRDPILWDGPVGVAHAKMAYIAEREAFSECAHTLWCGQQDAWSDNIDYIGSLIPNRRQWNWWREFGEPYEV